MDSDDVANVVCVVISMVPEAGHCERMNDPFIMAIGLKIPGHSLGHGGIELR